MDNNNFKDTLLEMKIHVNNFKGKKLMEQLVSDRLEMSFERYVKSLDAAYMYLLDKDPIKALSKINRLWGN